MSNYLCITSTYNVQVLIYSKHLQSPSTYIFPLLTFLKTYIFQALKMSKYLYIPSTYIPQNLYFPSTYIVPLQYQTCLPVL